MVALTAGARREEHGKTAPAPGLSEGTRRCHPPDTCPPGRRGKTSKRASFGLDDGPSAVSALRPGAGESSSRREANQELSQFIVGPWRPEPGCFLSF